MKIIKKLILITLLGIAATIVFTVFLTVPYVIYDDLSYRGSEVFLDEPAYLKWKSEFKTEVVEKEGKLVEYDILSSEPPILVSWEIDISYEQEFSFGTSKSSRNLNRFAGVIITIIIGTIFMSIPILLAAKPKEKDEN